jgi:hypothetical protein
MKFRRHEMRNESRKSAILVIAVLMAVALPVSVAVSREAEPPREIAARSNLPLPAAAIQPSALPPAAIQLTPEAGDWFEGATQSAYMVIVGSLLIGIGSVVRRTV